MNIWTSNLKRPRLLRNLARFLLYLILSVGAFTTVFPFLWMVSTSLKEAGSIFQVPPKLIPNPIVWSNYVQVGWTLRRFFPFPRFFLNSIVYTGAVVVGQIITCSLAAYAFARLKFRGRETIFLLYLGTLMIPQQVIMVPLFLMMSSFGWNNTYYGLIAPGIFSAFGTFLLRQFFLTIPDSLAEAAFIDGATHFDIYRKIYLPLAKPGLAALTMFTFMWGWNNFLWPLIIINEAKLMTLPLGLATLAGRYTVEWHLMMAGSVITIIPILIVFIFTQRYFVKGIAMGAIKG